MSWSVAAIGRPKAVAESVAKQLAAIKCVEPEETMKNKVAEIVSAALHAMPEGTAVSFTGNGSQTFKNYDKPEEGATNYLQLEIKPLYGFVE